MATQLLAHPALQTYPHPAADFVTQAELAHIQNQRRNIAQLIETLKIREAAILETLKDGAEVEAGFLNAAVRVTEHQAEKLEISTLSQ